MNGINILICGDFAPLTLGGKMINPLELDSLEQFKKIICFSDYSIVNYESPISSGSESPIKKNGPAIYSREEAIGYLSEIGFNCVTLANNHFRDYGQTGVENTIDACKKYKLDFVGGGKTINEARDILYKNIKNASVAIINTCEHEFSIASKEYGGSNPLDLINIQEDIAQARNKADYIIMIVHGGIEGYHFPTPRMKRVYRHFIDLGVDAVINHHQHCINGYEVYNEKPIMYGLGNFFFPGSNHSPESWKYGYAVQLNLSEKIGFEMIPYEQNENGIVIRDEGVFQQEINKFSIPIGDDEILQELFDAYVLKNEYYIKTQFFPSFLNNRYIKALANRGFLGKLFSGDSLYSIKNKVTCESHYEKIRRLFELLTK